MAVAGSLFRAWGSHRAAFIPVEAMRTSASLPDSVEDKIIQFLSGKPAASSVDGPRVPVGDPRIPSKSPQAGPDHRLIAAKVAH